MSPIHLAMMFNLKAAAAEAQRNGETDRAEQLLDAHRQLWTSALNEIKANNQN